MYTIIIYVLNRKPCSYRIIITLYIEV